MRWARAVHLVAVAVVLAGCLPAESSGPTGEIRGTVTAGPVCPVVTDPPDPACADRPVANAEIWVLDADGHEVARATSGADGRFSLELPAGAYALVPQPMTDLLGTAPRQDAVVPADGVADVALSYDTGIR